MQGRGAGDTGARGGSRAPYVLLKEGQYHYNLLYLLLNLFYHSNLKFILPKFGKQKRHLQFVNEMCNEGE